MLDQFSDQPQHHGDFSWVILQVSFNRDYNVYV
jgi:hypothetical protein